MGAARWLALLAVVTSSETACHSPKTSTSYVHEPPVASFRRPALAEVVTTMAVVGVWGGDDEASLAAFLGSLGAALPRATEMIVAFAWLGYVFSAVGQVFFGGKITTDKRNKHAREIQENAPVFAAAAGGVGYYDNNFNDMTSGVGSAASSGRRRR